MGRGRVAIIACAVACLAAAGTAGSASAVGADPEISGVAFRSTVQPDVIDFYVRVYQPPPSATAVDSLADGRSASVRYEIRAGERRRVVWSSSHDGVSLDPDGNYEGVTSDVLKRAHRLGRARYSVHLIDSSTGAPIDEVAGKLPTRFKSDGWHEDIEIGGRPEPDGRARGRSSHGDGRMEAEVGESEGSQFHRDSQLEDVADELAGTPGWDLGGAGSLDFGEAPFTTSGKAEVGNGLATVPEDAPRQVRQIIRAGNAIATLPYLWGGGHGSWNAPGYDCSGSVSYALRGAELVDSPMVSTGFMTFGEPGPGRWVTIYANGGHVFMVVAGLRFDTTGRDDAGTRWQAQMRPTGSFVARHPEGL